MPAVVYSFSVFDTCLTRLHARPLDQLFALAARVLPGEREREDQHEFVRMRLRAEEDAREGPGLEAAGLGMVWERFPKDNPWGLDPGDLYSTELSMALESALPVPPVLERVRGHARRGERVVYVTDSILPGPSLRRLLESHGFAGEVYCAGELYKCKYTGSLYRHLLAAQSIEARELLHCGADPLLDARVPKSMGIAVSPFPKARFTRHEEHLLSMHRSCQPEYSRVVAASRLARLRAEAGESMELARRMAASVAAPALTAFAAWAMDDAAGRGVRRLYFLAREGHVPWRLAREIHAATGGPEPRYLMGSLSAWTAPLAAGVGRSDLDWLAAEGQSRRPADILAKLKITPEELLRASGMRMPSLLSDAPLASRDLDDLYELLDSAGSRRLLADRSAEARELLLGYLQGEGALDEGRLAVADMGWTLYTQRSLRMVLASQNIEVEGWYFGLAGKRLGRMEAGPHHAMFMERAGRAGPSTLESALFGLIPLVERAFTRAGHGRVRGYERARGGAVRPVLGPEPPGAEFTREIEETALSFARALLAGGFGPDTIHALRESARESLRRFFIEPEPELARAVAALPDEGEGGRPLLRRLGLGDVARAWLSSLGAGVRPARAPLWLAGSAALSAGWLRPYLRSGRLMALLRDYFA
jgi:FMN phosphatase YigB (HAD superfamily)